MEDFFKNGRKTRSSGFQGFEMPDIISQMFNTSRSTSETPQNRPGRSVERGSDIRSGIDMPYSDAEAGCAIEFDRPTPEDLPKMRGVYLRNDTHMRGLRWKRRSFQEIDHYSQDVPQF